MVAVREVLVLIRRALFDYFLPQKVPTTPLNTPTGSLAPVRMKEIGLRLRYCRLTPSFPVIVHDTKETALIPAYDNELLIHMSDLYHGFSTDLLQQYLSVGFF